MQYHRTERTYGRRSARTARPLRQRPAVSDQDLLPPRCVVIQHLRPGDREQVSGENDVPSQVTVADEAAMICGVEAADPGCIELPDSPEKRSHAGVVQPPGKRRARTQIVEPDERKLEAVQNVLSVPARVLLVPGVAVP